MKYVWRIAFLALLLIPVAHAHADAEVVKKGASSQMRAFTNLDARLKYLESYKVIYVAADGKRQDVIKSAPARQMKKDGLSVELHKRKS